MINFKVCGIAAGAAFVLSLLIGVFSRTAFSVILVRGFVFAVVFFALSGMVFWLVSRYLPELLSGGGAGGGGDDLDIPASGSHVDISVGSPVAGAFPEDASDAIDDIAGSPSTGSYTARPSSEAALSQAEYTPLDHEGNTGYNQERGIDGNIGSPGGGGLGALEGTNGEALPDMGALAEGAVEDEQEVETEDFDSPESSPRSSSKKPAMEGDFDPKELAKAIHTVLVKDEKG
jgi:hypothetical protein